jgi:hypothetical protein
MTTASQRLRYADEITADTYPGATIGPVTWQRDAALWQTLITTAPLPAGSILAPSLALLENWPYDFQFELRAAEGCWPLPKVPSESASKAVSGDGSAVTPMLDCWHIEKPLSDVSVQVRCAAANRPERYLLAMTSRPRELTTLPAPPSRSILAPRPESLSQMLENPRTASRICSPVSLAMAITGQRPSTALHQILPLCLDPATGMYGMWPLAIRAASRFGMIGAVELLEDWSLVLASLDLGRPVVASIRYPKDGLAGSPQPATAGHLVIVHGIDGDRVLVNDPAAANRGTVMRRYDLAQFSEAWFRHRGAAYILAP